MSKAINIQRAMTEYHEELDWFKKNPINAPEPDPFWDCWYDVATFYEPSCEKDDETVFINTSRPSKDGLKARRRKRRSASFKHKEKLRENALVAVANYKKRSSDDFHNWSFRKRRNGEKVFWPASRSEKAQRLSQHAGKLKLIDDSLVIKYPSIPYIPRVMDYIK